MARTSIRIEAASGWRSSQSSRPRLISGRGPASNHGWPSSILHAGHRRHRRCYGESPEGEMKNSDAIIIGAGPEGLACAASMGALGLNATVLEKGNTVGPVWRRHYDRLHLHTDRGHSGLPGMDMPRTYPTYPSRAQVVEYLEGYAAQFGIQPVFNTTVRKVGRNGSLWSVQTGQTSLSAPVVVMATG